MYFKKPTALASAEPEVSVHKLSDKDLFMVLVTDGVTDVLTNQEVVDLAAPHWEDQDEAAKSIVREAFKRGTQDNLTAAVIQFGWADKDAAKLLENRLGIIEKNSKNKGDDGDLYVEGKTAAAVDDMDMFG